MRGIGERARGPHLVLLARSPVGWRSLSRLISRANLAGTKAVPRFRHALLEAEHEGVIALSGCRDGEIARRLRVGDRAGARAAAQRYASIFGRGDGPATSGFFIELAHHLLPDDDWLVAESVALAAELGLPVVVTNDVHYATPDDREFHDVLTAIKHGRTLDTLADLRRPDAESFLKSGDELTALGAAFDGETARAWREGIATSVDIAASCSVDLEFGQYRFPGFPVPNGETPFSYLTELCWAGARRRYHPLTSAVVKRLAHELDVIERAGLAEFFLICWDLMRFAKEQGIPAQGRGSATSSIVSYTLGISRVEPIAHNLLFERFINPGRTTYPDVDIDFSSERREEVIQYIYRRYGSGAHGDGLQPRDVPGAVGRARGRLRARVPAPVGRSCGQGARDVRLGDGPTRPRGRRRVCRVLPANGRGTPWRGTRSRGCRGARSRRQDGPAEHADPARREGAALAPATEAGGSGRTTTVRLAPGGIRRARGGSRGAAPPVRGRPQRHWEWRARDGRAESDDQNAAWASDHAHPIRIAPLGVARAPSSRETRPATTRLSSARTRSRRSRPSGRAARPTTRVARATPRRASPGCGRVAGPAIRARQARVPPRSRSTRRAA